MTQQEAQTVVELSRAGLTPSDIHTKTGLPLKAIYNVNNKWRKEARKKLMPQKPTLSQSGPSGIVGIKAKVMLSKFPNSKSLGIASITLNNALSLTGLNLYPTADGKDIFVSYPKLPTNTKISYWYPTDTDLKGEIEKEIKREFNAMGGKITRPVAAKTSKGHPWGHEIEDMEDTDENGYESSYTNYDMEPIY
jgi:hypothetical protein